jgi:hypothetical protein
MAKYGVVWKGKFPAACDRGETVLLLSEYGGGRVMAAVRRILRYVIETPMVCIWYMRREGNGNCNRDRR